MSLLYWLESIRNPALDFVMNLITKLGSKALFMVIALAVFWCVNKKEGYYLLFVGFVGTIANQFLKLLCQIPRPWVKNPSFSIVEAAKADANGYSFPSGHTQNAVGTLGAIARWQKQAWLRIACIVLLVLVAFSRMYLGVHTLMDVSVSFVIAAVLVLVLYPVVQKAADHPKQMYLLLGIMSAIALAFVLYSNLTDFRPVCTNASAIEEELRSIAEGRKNGYSLLGALLGFTLGYTLERKYLRFDEKAVWWVQIIKVVGGMALVLAIKEGLKYLFLALGFTWLGSNAIRYFAVVLFASAVWPMCFPTLSRLSKGGTKH